MTIHTSRLKPDGCYEIYYFDRLVGWVAKCTRRANGRPLWRALTTSGQLFHRASLASARSAILDTA